VTTRAGTLILAVWPDVPLGEHQRYAYRVQDTTTGRSLEGRDLFTGAGAPVGPGRALRELAGFLAAAGEARNYALDNPGTHPDNENLFPAWTADAALRNYTTLIEFAEFDPNALDAEPSVQEKAGRRWISVVFLQGSEADEVLDLIARDGTEAAIEHLAGYDYGEETTQAALENGYVYEAPPTGAADRVASGGAYTLTYNHALGHVGLLRQLDTPPDPALLGAEDGQPTTARAQRGQAGSPARHAAPNRAGTDWFTRTPPTPPSGQGLSL